MLLWLLFGLFVIGGTGVIYAHAELVGAEPAPGTAVTGSPEEIRLTFSEPVAAGSRVALFTPDFQSIAGVESHVEAQAPEQLVATVPGLEPGVYTVQWTAVSADGHEISGSYAFSVGGPFAEPGRPTEPLGWWQLLLLAAGALILVTFLWQYRRRSQPYRPRPPVQQEKERS